LKNINLIFVLFLFISGCQYKQPDYLQMLSPAELHKAMENEDIFLVDVHTPQQKHIKGTDAFIPYNEVDKNVAKLPQDKNTPIYLYCEGGPMGNAAAKTLHELGYQHLLNLDGGTNAWQKAGFAFE
jgi:rhodanese-related sulfurtransferase